MRQLPTPRTKCAILALAIVLLVNAKTLAGAGEEFSVTEIPFNRALPHAFHDQAVASIAVIHPDGEVLVSERVGTLGDFVYAPVAYRKQADDAEIYLDAIAVSAMRAWRLQGAFAVDELHRMQRVVLERIKHLR